MLLLLLLFTELYLYLYQQDKCLWKWHVSSNFQSIKTPWTVELYICYLLICFNCFLLALRTVFEGERVWWTQQHEQSFILKEVISSGLELMEVMCFLKLTTDQALVFDLIVGSCQVILLMFFTALFCVVWDNWNSKQGQTI